MEKRIFQQAHVFVVDSDSYPVHRDRLFCGVKNPNKFNIKGRPNNSYYGLLADLKTLRPNDLVFFYQMRKDEEKHKRGFRGVFKVKNIESFAFFDDTDIHGVKNSKGELGSENKVVFGKCPKCKSNLSDKTQTQKVGFKQIKMKICVNCGLPIDYHILPNRVLIEPLLYYENPIDDNTAYIDREHIREKGILWTMLFRKTYGAGRERSITHILPEESEKLIHLFKKLFKESSLNTVEPYPVSNNMKPLIVDLITKPEGQLSIEGMLEAWIMENIDKEIPLLKDIVGDLEELEYFGNQVLYGIGGEKVDVMCLHKRDDERFKATVMELKNDKLQMKDVEQIKDYAKWMSQLVFKDADSSKIQPVLIGFEAPQIIISAIKKTNFGTMKPIILEYTVNKDKLKFTQVF